MKRYLILLAVLCCSGLAQAQTDTPTATPTNTPTAVQVTPVAISTATPVPLEGLSQLNPPLIKGPAVLDGSSLLVLPPKSGGDLAATNEIIGKTKSRIAATTTLANGTTETVAYTDTSPAGEWTATGGTVVVSTDSTTYRVATASLKLAFSASAVAWDGAVTDITNDDLEADESIGFFFKTDTPIAVGDLVLRIDDTSVDTDFQFPAVGVVDRWIWIEINVASLASGTGNVVDKVDVLLTVAGASNLGAFNIWFDSMFKWDAADEEAVGCDVFPDSVQLATVATAAGSANTLSTAVLNTDYFIHYESGSDFIVPITDQSANSGLMFASCQ